MEVQKVLQTIGMEAAVLAFLFAMGFAAIRISIAERKAQSRDQDTLSTSPRDQSLA